MDFCPVYDKIRLRKHPAKKRVMKGQGIFYQKQEKSMKPSRYFKYFRRCFTQKRTAFPSVCPNGALVT